MCIKDGKFIAERTMDPLQGVIGTCPYCNSTYYEREFERIDGDVVEFYCECECEEAFREFFYLAYQEWIPTENQVKELKHDPA